jgi:hypothetical protein
MRPLLTLLVFIFALTLTYGQDTIILCKKKNNKQEIIIPSENFEIKVKPKDQKKLHVKLISSTDSTLTLRIGTHSTKKRKTQNHEYYELVKNTKYSQEQIDSVLSLKAYPILKTLKLSEIKYIIPYNLFMSPKLKKFYTALSIVEGVSWLAWLTSIAIKPDRVVTSIIFMTIVGETVILTSGLINRRINLDKWTIKITNNNR